jgi:predicted transcriptional regulator of viral defense system
MPANARSLSANESKVVLALEAEGRDELTLQDIATLANASAAYARKLAQSLVRKGWLQRLGRGRYLLNPARAGPDAIPDMNAFRVGSRLVSPSYFGYATGANLHGLLTRVPRAYFIVTTSRRTPTLAEPAEFRIVHVPARKFFGWTDAAKYGSKLRVSDVEKTLVDAIDRPDLVGGIAAAAQIVNNAKPRLDYDRLVAYAKRMRSKSLAQRLGYLLEHVAPRHQAPRAALEALQSLRGAAFVALGPPGRHGRKGRYVSRWRVIVNVPEDELLGEVSIR